MFAEDTSTKAISVNDDHNVLVVRSLFYSLNPGFAEPDYRCLNPDSHTDPTKWGTFHPNDLADAMSKE